MHTALVIAAMLVGVSETDPQVLALFTPLEFHFTAGKYNDHVFHYRLFDPRIGEADPRQFPLIVWLHGAGEAGDDNVDHLRWFSGRLMTAPLKRERFPFFVLAVQCPLDDPAWFRDVVPKEDDMLSVLTPILDETLENYPIDRDRVTLAGISSGGSGCWMFASRRPDYFAGVAPMSGGGFTPTPDRIAALKQLRIWAFNCRHDRLGSIVPVRETVQTLIDAGVNVHLSELEDGGSHDSWSAAFGDYDLLDWLLAQRRGDAAQLSEEIISPGRENVAFLLAFWHNTIFEFCRDIFRRWTWIQLPVVIYLGLVVLFVGRWVYKHVRIVRKRSRPIRPSVEPPVEPPKEIG